MDHLGARTRSCCIRVATWVATTLILTAIILEGTARLLAPFALQNGNLVFAPDNRQDPGIRTSEFNRVTLWTRPHPTRPALRSTVPGIRILAIGDSVWEPFQLPDNKGVLALLEHAVIARKHSADVVNLSESGFDVVRSTALARRELDNLLPDLVLIAISPNDHIEFVPRDDRLIDRQTLNAIEMRNRAKGVAGLLHRHSYIENWVWLLFEARRFERDVRRTTPELVRQRILSPLETLNRDLSARGIRLGAVFMPWLDSLKNDQESQIFSEVGAWAKTRGVAVLNAGEFLAPHANHGISMDELHLSAKGHQILAGIIDNWLIETGLVDAGLGAETNP